MIPEKIPQDFYSRPTDKRLEWWNQLLQSINETISTIKKSIVNAVNLATKTSITKTATHTILNSETYETYYFTTGASNMTCTLPAVADNTDKKVRIIKADSGAGYVTVDGNASETINGVASVVIEKQYCGLELHCTGSAWVITGTIGECEIQTIGSAIEMVYTKRFTGTTSSDVSGTNFAHGVTASKIIYNMCKIEHQSSRFYFLQDGGNFFTEVNGTNLYILLFSSSYYAKPYEFEIKYYI